ncbi:MAG: hypothetical protein DWQ05_06230 [Calditrichaeota bacterium]|nr:MAG: hypothetical protein DWQ05_06230 [Calditrichota bacterium]
MQDSLYLAIVEYSLWTACIGFVGYANYKVLKRLIKEDFKRRVEEESIHRYSSIVAIIASAIASILIYRFSNNTIRQSLINTNESLLIYISAIVLSFAIGYFWMQLIIQSYQKLKKRRKEIPASQFAKNVMIMMMATSFFTLLLSSPAIIDQEIPAVREVYLTFFLGLSSRYLFAIDINYREMITKFFTFFKI